MRNQDLANLSLTSQSSHFIAASGASSKNGGMVIPSLRVWSQKVDMLQIFFTDLMGGKSAVFNSTSKVDEILTNFTHML